MANSQESGGSVVGAAPGSTRQAGEGGVVRREINKWASPNAGSWTLMGGTFNWAVLPAFPRLTNVKMQKPRCSFQTEPRQMTAWLLGGNQTPASW